ncbi:PH domain-containing protein [Sanguibacter sp. 25GB23B1]|uniref:PH domain-containing protein n=1 Tax=unclassified Sanguibacter TaxID=2645534 RepID=UPI0032AE8CC2
MGRMTDLPADPAPTTSPFDPEGVTWQRVSLRLATARLVLAGIWLGVPLVVAAVLAIVLEQTWLWIVAAGFLVLLLWTAFVVGRQVRAIGYAERDDDLLIRKGVLFRTLVVVPYGRMQLVDVTAGPLARKLDIASVQLHTASPGTDATIEGLVPSEAARLRDRLASRGEARLAGL